MSNVTPRLRVFAGPNGSGKSTMKEFLFPEWLGVYVNADEMEKQIRQQGYLDFYEFGITAEHTALRHFLRASTLLQKADLGTAAEQLVLDGSRIYFGAIPVNSYFASVLADFIRHELLAAKQSFTFETVMSSSDKVDFLAKAQAAGFRTYLYFVATEDPEINIARVKHRVGRGGHNVPQDKIVERYARCLDLLFPAVTHTDRAYIFDNSNDETLWVAEITAGEELELKSRQMPIWFKQALWDKFE